MNKIEEYNNIVDKIVFEFVKKAYSEEHLEEKPDETDYDIMNHNGVNKGPVELWDSYLNLDDILMCQANNFTAKSLFNYNEVCMEAHANKTEVRVNYYSYAKYGIEGRKYTKEELEESKKKVEEAEKRFKESIKKLSKGGWSFQKENHRIKVDLHTD